ncbi:MAG: hypothetical protein MJ090_01435 [Clostridia bacterium]|nr:hypothetical protein [Clostridia bacterium]
MKEIGGYFGLESFKNNGGEYYKDLIALNTARNALVYFVKVQKIKKIFIPYLLCNSVSLVCDRENIEYEYYNIDENFLPVFDRQLKNDEYLYVVNLYGQIANAKLEELKNKYKNIIVDNIHAFFEEPIKDTATIYSCRKFFGVPDGAYLSSKSVLSDDLPNDNSSGRMAHIYGRIKDGASAHYAEFKANDESFKSLPLMKMSELTHKLLSEIDYKRIIAVREQNYSYLYNKLGGFNKLKLCIPKGPYAYPFYCENGLEIKKKLAQKKIYIATLWPNVSDSGQALEKDYAENILPLPIDQRYGIDEMNFICKEIMSILQNNDM